MVVKPPTVKIPLCNLCPSVDANRQRSFSTESSQCCGIAHGLREPVLFPSRILWQDEGMGFGLEYQYAKGRNGNRDAEGAVLPVKAAGWYALVNDLHGSAIIYVVAVEHLCPGATERNLNIINRVFDRGEIANDQEGIFRLVGKPEISQDAVVAVVTDGPLEAFVGKLPEMERPLFPIEKIKSANPMLQTSVRFVAEEIPAEF